MENKVYVLLRRLYDPYGCLEDNEADILGIFTTEEQANTNKDMLKQRDKRHSFDFWVDEYELNKLEEFF